VEITSFVSVTDTRIEFVAPASSLPETEGWVDVSVTRWDSSAVPVTETAIAQKAFFYWSDDSGDELDVTSVALPEGRNFIEQGGGRLVILGTGFLGENAPVVTLTGVQSSAKPPVPTSYTPEIIEVQNDRLTVQLPTTGLYGWIDVKVERVSDKGGEGPETLTDMLNHAFIIIQKGRMDVVLEIADASGEFKNVGYGYYSAGNPISLTVRSRWQGPDGVKSNADDVTLTNYPLSWSATGAVVTVSPTDLAQVSVAVNANTTYARATVNGCTSGWYEFYLIDLDCDSDNNGTVEESQTEEDIEESSKHMPLNTNAPDRQELILKVTPANQEQKDAQGFCANVEAELGFEGGAGLISIYDAKTGGDPLPLPKTYPVKPGVQFNVSKWMASKSDPGLSIPRLRLVKKTGGIPVNQPDGKPVEDKVDVVVGDVGFVQVWEKVPVVLPDQPLNPSPSAFQFKVFVEKPYAPNEDCTWDVQQNVANEWRAGNPNAQITQAPPENYNCFTPNGRKMGTLFVGNFAAFRSGTYRVRFQYKSSAFMSQPATVKGGKTGSLTAYQARIEGTKTVAQRGMLVTTQVQQPARYGILPFSCFSDDKQKTADLVLSDKWQLTAIPADGMMVNFASRTGVPSVEFGDFVQVTAGAAPEAKTRVNVNPVAAVREGDGALRRNKTKGLFYMDGAAKVNTNLENDFALPGTKNTYWTSAAAKGVTVADVAGHIDDFYLIVPDLDIGSPNGDPETTGVGGANAENEQVFDDLSPAGEPAGQCRFTMAANVLSKLTTAARALIFPKCGWHLGALGNAEEGLVQATFNPADGKGQSIAVTYGTMPTRYNHFGKKTITMSMDNTEFKWYQDVEFFFCATKTARGGGNPNWFTYWLQAMPTISGVNIVYNPAHHWDANNIGSYRPGFEAGATANDRTPQIEIYRGGADRGGTITPVTQFAGIYHHERQHHSDFVSWWPTTGVVPKNYRERDTDGDFMPDAFETNYSGEPFNLNPATRQNWHDNYSQTGADQFQAAEWARVTHWESFDYSDFSARKDYNRRP
jgi:hypothetical protein